MSLPEKKARRHTGAGSIYAIGAMDYPYVKIGSTTTPVEQRLQSLQTGQPATLHIIATQAVETDLHRIERQIHGFLAAERHHGEWFALKLDAEELAALIHRAVAYLAEQDRTTQQKIHGQKLRPRAKHRACMALRDQCDKAGITLTTLATRAGMHLSALSRVEHGRQQLTLREGVEIAKILGCQIKELFAPFADEAPRQVQRMEPQQPRKGIAAQEAPPTDTPPQLSWGW